MQVVKYRPLARRPLEANPRPASGPNQFGQYELMVELIRALATENVCDKAIIIAFAEICD